VNLKELRAGNLRLCKSSGPFAMLQKRLSKPAIRGDQLGTAFSPPNATGVGRRSFICL
jgi:hypothetical protein